jgi:hypothetical protein
MSREENIALVDKGLPDVERRLATLDTPVPI